MKVSDLMLPGVQTVTPSQAIHEALVTDSDFPAQLDGYAELTDLLVEQGAGSGDSPNGELVSGEISCVFADEDGLHSRLDKAGEH